MNLVDHYNQSFRRLLNEGDTSYYPNQSLLKFLNSEVWSRLPFTNDDDVKILELGCGHGSLFQSLETPNWQVTALDFSEVAIDMARSGDTQQNIVYKGGDIREVRLENEFDLVVDAHCLHCLGDPSDWQKGLDNIFNGLKPGGFFALETMVASKEMDFEEGYFYYEEMGSLFLGDLAIRRILSARQIEEALLICGFQINYLRVFENTKIIPVDGRQEALKSDPDLMQILCFRSPGR